MTAVFNYHHGNAVRFDLFTVHNFTICRTSVLRIIDLAVWSASEISRRSTIRYLVWTISRGWEEKWRVVGVEDRTAIYREIGLSSDHLGSEFVTLFWFASARRFIFRDFDVAVADLYDDLTVLARKAFETRGACDSVVFSWPLFTQMAA